MRRSSTDPPFNVRRSRRLRSAGASSRADHSRVERGLHRRGQASVDAVLVIGIILPLAAIALPLGVRILRSLYSFFYTWVAWPFM